VSAPPRGGPLEGIRVVELTKVWAGPYVGKLFAYLGAEVIRVESLEALDTARAYNVSDIDNAPGFQAVNPQKLSVQINTKTKAGVDLLLQLLGRADLFVENLRPGAIARMGLGYEQARAAKPDIVYLSMGMYGNDGPLAHQSGYAPSFCAVAGLSAQVGYAGGSPRGMNVRYGDSTAGTAAAYAAMVALLHRRRTGLGQFVDLSTIETLASMVGDLVVEASVADRGREPTGNRHPDMAPHGAFRCLGGAWISIAVGSDAAWQALATAMGRAELARDPRFCAFEARKANEAALDQLVSGWTASREAEALAAQLQSLGVAAAKSASAIDLVADPQLWSRDFYRTLVDRAARSRPTVGPSWKMTRDAEIRDCGPGLGEHNAYVLGEILGLSADEQARLAEAGVVR
jgi:crotonobetainyl-CoA:carnitine CoA-transferase CaiB-like acyl-CoA transferase